MAKEIILAGVVGDHIKAGQLRKLLPDDGSDVLLKVDSVGGSVYEGNRLYNAIADYPGTVKVELGALAASAASYFILAAGVENISVRENTTYMIHRSFGLVIGNADDLRKQQTIQEGFDNIMAREYSKATGRSVDSLLKDMSEEAWYFGGEAIIAAGFASSLVKDRKTEKGPELVTEPMKKSEVTARLEEAKLLLRNSGEDESAEDWAATIAASLGSNSKPVSTPQPTTTVAPVKPITAALHDDRARIAKIVQHYGNSEKALKAITDGTTFKDLAADEVVKARAAARKAADIPVNFGKVTAEGQLPEAVTTDEAKQNAADRAVENYLKSTRKDSRK